MAPFYSRSRGQWVTRLHLDFETFATLDIKKVTTSKYTSHPDTEILMLGWAVDNGPVNMWEPRLGEAPSPLIHLLHDPDATLHAYNAPFERGLIEHKMGIPTTTHRWRDTMVEAFALSFPAGLDRVLEATGLQKKDPHGSRLINIFSKPAPRSHKADRYDWQNKPDEWQEFVAYCVQDVEVERQLYHWLQQYGGMSEEEWEIYFLDQEINRRGLPVDLSMAEGALHIWQREKAEIAEELSEITGLYPTTRGPFLAWLTANDCPLENTQKDTIRKAIKEDQFIEVHRALELWGYKEVRALDKYKTILAAEQNGRLYNIFQYGGASRTRRWAGRVFQPHNLKRTLVDVDQIDTLAEAAKRSDLSALKMFWPEHPISELLGSAIRHAVCAEEGKLFVAADLGSIESRVIGWVTNCSKMNRVFAEGKDSYVDFAAGYFGIPYAQVTKEQRGFSKPPVLGAGFGLGWRGMIAYAEGYGVSLNEDEAKRVVNTFRSSYWEIPEFWEWIDNAVKQVTMSGVTVEGFKLKILKDREFLCIQLPSGRCLWYYQPQILPHETPWGQIKPTFSYMGLNDKNQWIRLYVHPGLLTENVVQAIARDFLAYGMKLTAEKGLEIVLHVHDEIVVETGYWSTGAYLKVVIDCMTTKPPWASDIILGAEGYIAKRYRKD